jgi:hypothetical protein
MEYRTHILPQLEYRAVANVLQILYFMVTSSHLWAIMWVMGRLGGREWAGLLLSPGVRGERGGTRSDEEAELVLPHPPPPDRGDLGLATGLAP